jgi:DNA-binding NtrC family response regulator
MRILLIENDPIVREIMWDYLTLEGHSVVGVSNEEAFSAYRVETYDVVISDCHDSTSSGLELIHRILKIKPHQRLLMTTGDYDLKAPEVASILYKPFRLSSIGQALVQFQKPSHHFAV